MPLLPDGSMGVLVFTSLSKEAMPVSRSGNLDRATIHVERKAQTTDSDKDAAASLLKNRIKSYVGISSTIVVHDDGGITRSEGKAKRVVDKRK